MFCAIWWYFSQYFLKLSEILGSFMNLDFLLIGINEFFTKLMSHIVILSGFSVIFCAISYDSFLEFSWNSACFCTCLCSLVILRVFCAYLWLSWFSVLFPYFCALLCLFMFFLCLNLLRGSTKKDEVRLEGTFRSSLNFW